MHDAELTISVRKTSLNSRFFPFTGFLNFLGRKTQKPFKVCCTGLINFFLIIYVYVDFRVEQCSIC